MAVTTTITTELLGERRLGETADFVEQGYAPDLVRMYDLSIFATASAAALTAEAVTYEFLSDDQPPSVRQPTFLTDPAAVALPTATVAVASTTTLDLQAADAGHVVVQFLTRDSATGLFDLGRGQNADAAAAFLASDFVVAYERPFTGADTDIYLQYVNRDGVVTATRAVDTSLAADRNASVAVLASGEVVVAWDRTDASGRSALWYATYRADGAVVTAPTLIDGTGAVNREASVTATGDAFVISYENGNRQATEVAQFWRGADGSTRLSQVSDLGERNGEAATSLFGGMIATAYVHTYLSGGQERFHDVRLSLTDPVTGKVVTSRVDPWLIEGLADTTEPALLGLEDGKFLLAGVTQQDPFVHEFTRQFVVRMTGDDADDRLIAGRMPAAYVLVGGSGDDTLVASTGDDRMNANAGIDVVTNSSGNDDINGGGGTDTLRFADVAPIRVDLGVATGQQTGLGRDTIAGFENVVGTGQRDRITGDDGANVLDGGINEDVETQRDTLTGGRGDDTYVVRDDRDVVVEDAAGGGVDTVRSLVTHRLAANVETLLLVGGDIGGTGNDLDNTIVGSDGRNTIDGLGGVDTMNGGLGVDTYVVGSAGDRIVEAGTDSDVAYATASYSLAQAPGVDLLFALLPDVAQAMDLTGNALGNTIRGNAGANVITGGFGADTLISLGGADTFRFEDVTDSQNPLTLRDVIADFRIDQGDRMDLRAVDAVAGQPGNQAFDYLGTDDFTRKAGELRIILTTSTTTLLVGDVDGDASGDFVVQLTGLVALRSQDILV